MGTMYGYIHIEFAPDRVKPAQKPAQPKLKLMGSQSSRRTLPELDALADHCVRPTRITVVGLERSGKKSLMWKLKEFPVEPSRFYPVLSFTHKQLTVGALDIRDDSHPLPRTAWDSCEQSDALVFVVDAGDPARFGEAAEYLYRTMEDPSVRGKPLLILANKQYLPTCVSAHEFRSGLMLDVIARPPWHVVQTNPISGEGLGEALEWLDQQISASADEHAHDEPDSTEVSDA